MKNHKMNHFKSRQAYKRNWTDTITKRKRQRMAMPRM